MAEKKPKQEEESGGESAPIWVISFADLVTLLMSFFVILAAGNPKDVVYDPEFAEIVAAIKKAFKYLPPANSKDPVDLIILRQLSKLKKNKGNNGNTGKPGESHTKVDGMSGRNEMVTTIRTGTQTTIGSVIPFAKGSSRLYSDSIPILENIARQIKGHTNVFVVKGHTSRDEEYALRNSDKDLAYERAKTVVRELVKLGVPRQALRIQSCRDFEPLKQGAYNEVSRSVNRRVEVIATESLISEYKGEPANQTPTPKVLLNTSTEESSIGKQNEQQKQKSETTNLPPG